MADGVTAQSGYRNRLLPLPIPHRQPPPAPGALPRFSTEPVLLQLQPFSAHGQYVLSWRIAETLPPDLDAAAPPPSAASPSAASPPLADVPAPPPPPYEAPPPYPPDLTLRARVALDRAAGDGGGGGVYEPVRREGTGVDAEECEYRAALLPVAQALRALAGTGQERVVRVGWEAICLRDRIENG